MTKEVISMCMQKEKLDMLTTIITFVSSVVTFVNSIYKNFNILFYLSLICVLIAGALSCYCLIKRQPILKNYKFIRYLFFETKENKFNIAPKLLLFSDLQKVKNSFEVKNLVVKYTITKRDDVFDSTITYNLCDVSNVENSNFYYYAGIDSGEIQKQKLIIYCNGTPETRPLLPDNQINSENGIFLYHWNIPDNFIKKDNTVEKIELKMEQKNSFDLNQKEAIYLFPWNIAAKIEKIELIITYPAFLGEISMQLFELGKIKREKFPYHSSLNSSPLEKDKSKDGTTISYKFDIKDVNVENLYYILLQKINY